MTTDHADDQADPVTWRRRQFALAAIFGFAVAWNLLGNLVLPGAWYVPANLAAAGFLLVAARWAELSWEELGLGRPEVWRGVVIGLTAATIVLLVIGLGLLVPAAESFFQDDGVAADSDVDRWFVPLVRIPLGTAVFEEILFRSVFFAFVVRLRDVRTGIIATSIVFGLWHIVPAWESTSGSAIGTVGAIVGTVVVTTVAGIVFALLRVWSRSIVAPVLAHWATNSLAYAAALVALDLVN
jgi:membrane protease YdiL (CAAX protease family)